MASFNDYVSALKFRDLIADLINKTFQEQYPRPRIGQVTSIDRPNYRCNVQFPGETNQVTILMGSLQPKKVGQMIRVAGPASQRYIDDIMGEPYLSNGPGFASGDIIMTGATVRAGWVACDGSTYDGTNPLYLDLWNAIGLTYGGTGQSAFNVPDLGNKFPRGNTRGTGGGVDTHAHTSAAHSHTLSDAGAADLSWSAAAGPVILRRVGGVSWTANSQTTANQSTLGASSSAQTGGLALSGTTDSATPGSTGTASNVPVYTGVAFFIKL